MRHWNPWAAVMAVAVSAVVYGLSRRQGMIPRMRWLTGPGSFLIFLMVEYLKL